MFINTGIIPFFINNQKDAWFIASGLVVDSLFNIVGVSFISPITYILDPLYVMKL